MVFRPAVFQYVLTTPPSNYLDIKANAYLSAQLEHGEILQLNYVLATVQIHPIYTNKTQLDKISV